MGYQKSIFPVTVYGCLDMDTESKKVLWIYI